MRLIGIKLGVCDPLVRKALKDDTWYTFGDYSEPTAENGWEWLSPEQRKQEEACKQMYKSVVDGEDITNKLDMHCGQKWLGERVHCLIFSTESSITLPAFDTIIGDNENLKKECLTIYRNHIPNTHLYKGVEDIFNALHQKNIKIGIITDGRPEGQRAKIDALGLEKNVDEIIVTDEPGGTQFRKPCDIAFRIMQKKLGVSYDAMVYVGDNPKKDFVAPLALGMKSVWFKNVDGVYILS